MDYHVSRGWSNIFKEANEKNRNGKKLMNKKIEFISYSIMKEVNQQQVAKAD